MRATLIVLALYLTACTAAPAGPGEPYCVDGVPQASCTTYDDNLNPPWGATAACGGQVYAALRWRLEADGTFRPVEPHPSREEAGRPATCNEAGEPLCADGSAPTCDWWTGPTTYTPRDGCLQLMMAEGATEADCYIPMARYPADDVDPSTIFLRNVE